MTLSSNTGRALVLSRRRLPPCHALESNARRPVEQLFQRLERCRAFFAMRGLVEFRSAIYHRDKAWLLCRLLVAYGHGELVSGHSLGNRSVDCGEHIRWDNDPDSTEGFSLTDY